MIFHLLWECGHKFQSFCHKSRVRQTDGLTGSFIVTRPSCIQCSAVKIFKLSTFAWYFIPVMLSQPCTGLTTSMASNTKEVFSPVNACANKLSVRQFRWDMDFMRSPVALSNVKGDFPKANSAFLPSGVGKWVPASSGWEAKAGMVHSVSGWTRGVQVKLWDPLRTRAILERLRFTTRRYANPPLLLSYFYLYGGNFESE